MPALPATVRGMPRVYLSPGEVIATSDRIVVQTTLGSCVSVTLRDPLTGFSAMCHAAMPEAPDTEERSLRYVDQAIEELLSRFSDAGVPLMRVTAKVIGGARRLGAGATNPRYGPIGPRNVEVALACLARHRLTPEAQDTGGERGRRVLFVVATGEVFVRQLGGIPAGGRQ